jgi:hypothetical protein
MGDPRVGKCKLVPPCWSPGSPRWRGRGTLFWALQASCDHQTLKYSVSCTRATLKPSVVQPTSASLAAWGLQGVLVAAKAGCRQFEAVQPWRPTGRPPRRRMAPSSLRHKRRSSRPNNASKTREQRGGREQGGVIARPLSTRAAVAGGGGTAPFASTLALTSGACRCPFGITNYREALAAIQQAKAQEQAAKPSKPQVLSSAVWPVLPTLMLASPC